jgi:hypothetical protein
VSAAIGKDIVNNPTDAYVPNSIAIQKAWLQHLVGKWGKSTVETGVKYYILDNEPSLWYANLWKYSEAGTVTKSTRARSGKKQMRGRKRLYIFYFQYFMLVGAEGVNPPILCSQNRSDCLRKTVEFY